MEACDPPSKNYVEILVVAQGAARPKLFRRTIDLYKHFNILPLNLQHDLLLIKLVHKILYFKSAVPDVFQDYFTFVSNDANYVLRKNLNVKITRFNTCRGQRSFIYKGSKLWNNLPLDVKSTIIYTFFKN